MAFKWGALALGLVVVMVCIAGVVLVVVPIFRHFQTEARLHQMSKRLEERSKKNPLPTPSVPPSAWPNHFGVPDSGQNWPTAPFADRGPWFLNPDSSQQGNPAAPIQPSPPGTGSGTEAQRDATADRSLSQPGLPDKADTQAKGGNVGSPSNPGTKSNNSRWKGNRYPITVPVPDHAVRVDEETPLEVGTSLGACWGRRWWDVTVTALNDDGQVTVHWEKFPSTQDSDLNRDELIIPKVVLEKLRKK